jgi:serine/threonine protein phosphatase 1
MHADIIYNIDTGAGSRGRLTIMDVDTHEYWQSDPVNDIYGSYKPGG